MGSEHVITDERSVAASHRGGFYAYLVMSWLLVGGLALRGLRPDWLSTAPLPLDILVVLAGGALTHLGYTLAQRATSARALAALAMSGLLAAIVALAFVFGGKL